MPVLISVGYAACHWCHVMAHESFEDDDGRRSWSTSGFVAIKVDREERPDVDAVYMTATQAMTGQGGWPMTVFATPDGEPFFCGTYFPQPSFSRLLGASRTAWRDQRDAVLRAGRRGGRGDRAAPSWSAGRAAPITAELLDAAAAQLRREHDPAYGGFGGAPKFPPHMALLFLLRHHQRTGAARRAGDRPAHGRGDGPRRHLRPAGRRVRPIRGRRHVDGAALREDALRQRAAAAGLHPAVAAHRRPAGPAGRRRDRAASCSATWHRPSGGFASALDADTDGRRGPDLRLDPGPAARGARRRGRRLGGRPVRRHREGHVRARHAACCGWPATSTTPTRSCAARWRDVRARLLAARGSRPQPARDDKVVAAWNGLAITALAEYAPLTGATTRPPTAAVAAGRRAAWPSADAHRRRPAAPGLPRRRGRASRPGCWRTTAAWPRRSARCTS